MGYVEEEWNVCNPLWKKNFRCKLVNNGLWRREQERLGYNVWGKWVFVLEQKDSNIGAPTFADQRNFFTGLIEAEWRNDNFVFPDGSIRPAQKDKKLKMFQTFFDDVRNRFNEGTPNGITYYLNMERVMNGRKVNAD